MAARSAGHNNASFDLITAKTAGSEAIGSKVAEMELTENTVGNPTAGKATALNNQATTASIMKNHMKNGVRYEKRRPKRRKRAWRVKTNGNAQAALHYNE